MYRACIFDLDGTLTDSLESLTYSVNETMKELKLPEITSEQCREFVGNGAKVLIEKTLKALGDEGLTRFDEAFATYQRIFDKCCTYRVKPYPGIPEMLRTMKERGMKLGVLSNKPDRQAVHVVEEIFGKTTTQIREQLFDIVRDNQIMSQERDNLVKDIKVTPAQVRRYFKDVPEDSIPFVPTQVEVQIIMREPEISQEEIDRVKNELRDYTERINSGQTQFSTLALMYSEDKGSAVHGGELGFMGRGNMVPEFANAAFSLTDPKTISKVVETEYGFHIIQLIEKRGDRINVRHILRRPKVSDAELTKTISEVDSIADEIRRNVFTFDEATQYISTDKDTRNNHGLMVNPNTGSSKFEMKDLPQEVAKVVVNMNVGEISKPFVMMNNSEKEVVAIVKLKNKVEGHKANMRDDYQLMQDIVHNKLCEEKIDKWIRDMQKTTYVRINEEWRNCEFKYPGWIK